MKKPARSFSSSGPGRAGRPGARPTFGSGPGAGRSFSDRPDRGPRSFSDRPDRGPRSFSDRPDRGPRSFSDRPDRGPRPFSDRPDRGGDRPEQRPRSSFGQDRPERGASRGPDREFRGPRPDGGERGARPFSSRPPGGGAAGFSKSRFIERASGTDERRPSFGDRPERSQGDRPQRDRPSFGNRDDRGTDRRPGGDGPQRDRPSFGNRDDRGGADRRPSFGDRPAYGNRDDRNGGGGGDRRPSFGNRPSYGNRDDRAPREGGFRPEGRGEGRTERPFGQREERGGNERPPRTGRSFGNKGPRPERAGGGYNDRGNDRGPARAFDDRGADRGPARFGNRDDRGNDSGGERGNDRGPSRGQDRNPDIHNDRGNDRGQRGPRPEGGRPWTDARKTFGQGGGDRPEYRPSNDAHGSAAGRNRMARPDRPERESRTKGSFTDNAVRRSQEQINKNLNKAGRQTARQQQEEGEDNTPLEERDGKIRLNRFIAAAGICSRREADSLIEEGRISVNGKTVAELGFKVSPTDQVKLGSRTLRPEKFVYILLNKPKNVITTLEDEEGRRTVMDMLNEEIRERIYPVGRLDLNTTGLLLMTNDGDLAERLMHPSFEIRKVYQVELDRPISEEDFGKIRAGVRLEDGPAGVDDIAVLSPDRLSLGLELHIGRNRIVRRIFEHLGYSVRKLDRVMYGGLTKKDLPRGKFRHLSPQEVINLKHLGK